MSNHHLPIISVVIPFYNQRSDLFKDALDSVLSQSYTNWEAIIVNDGSNKESKIFLENCVKEVNDERISVIHLDKNQGPSIAYNTGIEAAKGEIITWLDSDDIHLPWYYEEILNTFSKNPSLSILVVNCLFYVSLGCIKKIRTNKPFYKLLEGNEKQENLLEIFKHKIENIFPMPSFRREVFKTIKFDPGIRFGEDNDFYLQILKNKSLLDRTMVAPIAGYLYRIYPSRNRLTHHVKLKFSEVQKIIKKYNYNDSSLAYKTIQRYKNSPSWKFSELLDDYFTNGSILNYLNKSFLMTQLTTERISSLKVLIDSIFQYKILMPLFGVNSRFTGILFSIKDNMVKKIKKMFYNHLNKNRDEKVRFYAKRIYKRIF